MTYYLPRPRRLRIESGDLTSVTWPAEASVIARLRPADLFGASSSKRPRQVIPRGTSTAKLWWNANNGTGEFECSDFLPRAQIGPLAITPYRAITLDADLLQLVGPVRSTEDVVRMGYYIEYSLAPLLSAYFGVFVGIEELTARIHEGIQARIEIAQFTHGVAINTEQDRVERITAASLPIPASGERLLVAALYLQHAERLDSSAETRVPDLCVSEIIINLTKCLQVLFGESREDVRTGCYAFGLTSDEVEQCIVPVMLFRDQLDGAHAAINPVPQVMLDVMRQFVGRAVHNIRAVLIIVHGSLVAGRASLAPVVSDTKRTADREKLVERMKAYLAVDGLAVPDVPTLR